MWRDVISDETWAVIGPLFPRPKAMGRPPADRRQVLEAAAWHYRTGAPWRDLPERFGNWNTISCGCISTARRCRGQKGPLSNYRKFGLEPEDHAIGRSRGGLTTKSHLVCDGKGRTRATRRR